jgi:vacuolar-type H+-ATPase subunit D/Vma8
MRMGGQMLRQASVGLKPAVAMKVVARSSVGVEYPSVSAEPLPLQPVGLMWTDVSFDEARLRLRALTITLARLGEAENALWRLLAASRKTQKRVNALKYNIIPALPGDGASHPRRPGRRRAQYPVPDQGVAGKGGRSRVSPSPRWWRDCGTFI